METTKHFSFLDKYTKDSISVDIKEVIDADFGLYVWPCAPVLAQYIIHRREKVKDKRVLEIGAGTALAGIVAAKVGARVILSDAAHLDRCLDNCKASCSLNGLTDIKVIGITWGELDKSIVQLDPVDFILGSDCFYDSKDFEEIIMTVAYLIDKNPKAEFWTTYQERSSDRSIDHLLLKWGLIGEEIPLEEFNADSTSIGGPDLPRPHTIRMFIIRKSDAG